MVNVFEDIVGKYRLFKNRDALSPHYIPDTLPFREVQIDELSRKISPVFSGRKPENIFIYGKTGTGKTAVTKKVLRDLNEYANRTGLPVKGYYINGRMYESEHKVVSRLASLMDKNFDPLGYSTSTIYDRILSTVEEGGLRIVVALDEIDMVKRASDLIYRLNRANDEIERGSISIIGISNNIAFKDRLDARTRSTLCEVEIVFPPYNAEQLTAILEERSREAFNEGAISPGAIRLAAALSARHSGDARYALQLLLRAGDIAEEEGASRVEEEHVNRAKDLVEEDIVYDMIATLPDHHKLVLLALGTLKLEGKGVSNFEGKKYITSGLLYTSYRKMAEVYGMTPASDRWLRECLNELETYGIITLRVAGTGFRGNTRIVDLNVDPRKLVEVLRKNI